MSNRVEMVVGFVGQGANGAAAANTLVLSTASGTSSYVLANNIGQVVVSITSIVPALAPIGLQTNTLAGTMTFLKIIGDIKAGAKVDNRDVLTLMGNVAGVVATVAVLTGAGPVAITAAAFGVFVNVVGIGLSSGGLVDYTANMIERIWPSTQPALTFNEYHYDIQGRVRRYDDILNDPESGFSLWIVKDWGNIEFSELPEPPPRRGEDDEVDGDGLE
ncbi:hypothetical protein [Pseudoduganella chitinolytica]|uniref:Uncharacterized protein n=1 Tax=Pseudoduganella chitinolytica TaxID=34070 RepID=A0ABY8B683_9BURK|nr:hypothetical protein [Pseudoduganella chitinolytica]WEF31439.1 hypothetical protein PX653_18485 [Pseudoduganella chitinolytica]